MHKATFLFMRVMRVVLGALLCAMVSAVPAWSAGDAHWVGTWAAAPDQAGPAMKPQTLRQIVRASVGGARLRIRLSNLYGSAPLVIGPAHVAADAGDSAIAEGSDHVLTFGGKPTVTIAAGEGVVSDAVEMAVAPLQQLAVSMYLPHGATVSTLHGSAIETVYAVEGSDATSSAKFPAGAPDDSRYFLTDVEVNAVPDARVLVTVGDSITDGVGSTPDRNLRWPDALAVRLQGQPSLAGIGVLNAGISGNRILNDAADPFIGPSVLARFERDALSKPGVHWVALLAGINDITATDMLADSREQVSARQIIAGLQTLIARAHAKGIKVWGATLLPRGGSVGRFAHTPTAELKRQSVNAWIRGAGAFDAIIDFDLVLRDPKHPDRLRDAFDSGDHTHPNDAGHRAMAESIDLGLFGKG
jgi:lysophospholipase L1-like esterase